MEVVFLARPPGLIAIFLVAVLTLLNFSTDFIFTPVQSEVTRRRQNMRRKQRTQFVQCSVRLSERQTTPRRLQPHSTWWGKLRVLHVKQVRSYYPILTYTA